MKNEKALIREIQKKPEKFGIIYDQYFQLIFNYILKRTIDFELTKDICSEVFLKAFLNIGNFRWKGISIVNWLYRIASNEINQYHRSKKYKPKFVENIYQSEKLNSIDLNLTDEFEQVELELQKHKEFRKVMKQINLLSAKYREVISLKYFEQLSAKQIAEILNKKEGTVKSLISRGLDQVRSKL